MAGMGTLCWEVGEHCEHWWSSPNLAQLLGVDLADSTARAQVLSTLPAPDAAELAALTAAARAGSATSARLTFRLPRGERVLAVTLGPASRPGPEPSRSGCPQHHHLLLGVVADVTEETRRHRQEVARALTDPFLGIANRSGLAVALEEAVANHGRAGLVTCYLASVDLVRSTFGPGMADEVLRVAAERVQTVVRPGDVVGRLGTRELAVVLAGASAEGTVAVAERLRAACSEALEVGGMAVEPEVAIGVAHGIGGELGADPAGQLLRRALVATAEARRLPAPSRASWAPGLGDSGRRRLAVASALRRALAEGSVSLAYHPLVALASGQVIGAEALLRCHDPELGSLAPSEVVPVAEQTGLIVRLGRLVLESACAEASCWQDRPGRPQVAVNLSGRQLRDPDLVETVSEVLERTKLPPERLELEVTESVLVPALEEVASTLATLRNQGVRIALDDFGTGYSSLAYLDRLPVDTVKLDMGFVRTVGAPRRQVLVGSVVELAHRLGLAVVAEGIETEAQRRTLLRLSVDLGQGFLFSRPVPAPAFRELLAAPLRVVHAHGGS
jgi:diguanylate cyclase (GGDEF)-like protein